MNIVSDKYRNTRRYDLAYNLMIGAAARGQVIYYTELAPLVGLQKTGNLMGAEIGHLLGEISEDEHRAGRPLLSSIVVNSTGKPGPGYYRCARDVGRLRGTDTAEERAFWKSEKEAVCEYWGAHLTDA